MRSIEKIKADIESCETGIRRGFRQGQDTARAESVLLQFKDEFNKRCDAMTPREQIVEIKRRRDYEGQLSKEDVDWLIECYEIMLTRLEKLEQY